MKLCTFKQILSTKVKYYKKMGIGESSMKIYTCYWALSMQKQCKLPSLRMFSWGGEIRIYASQQNYTE